MTQACSRANCFAPDIGCDLGHLNLGKCPAWGHVHAAVDPGMPVDDAGILLPWSGGPFGVADVGFVAGRSKPKVIGVIGPQNAGKTTLLAAWYLLLSRGARLRDGLRFAGSYSLIGWEIVANSMRWVPGGKPGFPPHTSSRGNRSPGLLHMAVRHPKGQLRDYLIADAPGEWFQRWAINRSAPEAEGARWLAEHADVFLFVADREALSGPSAGSARGTLQLLASRLGAERRRRPVALVWSKADVAILAETEATVREAVVRSMPNSSEFKISLFGEALQSETGEGLLEVLDWAFEDFRLTTFLPRPSDEVSDPFLTLGR